MLVLCFSQCKFYSFGAPFVLPCGVREVALEKLLARMSTPKEQENTTRLGKKQKLVKLKKSNVCNLFKFKGPGSGVKSFGVRNTRIFLFFPGHFNPFFGPLEY